MKSKLPKQYIEVDGQMIIRRCVERLLTCKAIHGIWIVAEEGWQDKIRSACPDHRILGFSKPGQNRQLSILNGLRDIAAEYSAESIILIHDAVRPLVTVEVLNQCIRACEDHDGAMPVLPMVDTVYYSNPSGDSVEQLLDRSRVYAGQAPEAFHLGNYLKANEALLPEKILSINGSTEPAVLAGMDIALIPGDRNNFKITTQEDLEQYREIVRGMKEGDQ